MVKQTIHENKNKKTLRTRQYGKKVDALLFELLTTMQIGIMFKWLRTNHCCGPFLKEQVTVFPGGLTNKPG